MFISLIFLYRRFVFTVASLLLVLIVAPMPGAQATIIEVGDLNIIDDTGNPSDGLRYLDMSFSDGLTLDAALTNAQAVYANARLATPDEFDDLFAAAGISYVGPPITASDGFNIGLPRDISSGMNYDGGALMDALGTTNTTGTLIWTAPDGPVFTNSTIDALSIARFGAAFFQFVIQPANPAVGFLLVSAPTTVATPATLALLMIGLAGLGFQQRKSV